MLGQIQVIFHKISLTEKLLYLLIILVPVMRVPNLPFIGQKIQYSDIVFLILFFIWLVKVLKGTVNIKNVPLMYPLIGMLILFLFSFIHSQNWLRSGIEFAGILYLACLYMLLCQLVGSQELMWRLVKCWCRVSLLIALTGICAYVYSAVSGYPNFLIVNHEFLENANPQLALRLTSIFRHPAMLALYLHASVVFAFALAANSKNDKEARWGYLVAALCFTAAFLTKTRDSAGIAITLFLVLVSLPKENIFVSVGRYIALLYALAIAIFVIGSMIWWIFPVTLHKDWEQKKMSIEWNATHSTHFVRYKTQARIMKDYPWVGAGLGMYNYKSADYIKWSDVKDTYHVVYPDLTEKDEYQYKKGIDPHSLYLGLGAETGLLGLGGLLFFLLRMIVQFITKIKKESNVQTKHITWIFLAGLTGFLFNGLYIDMLSVRCFWFLMAMGTIYVRLSDQDARKKAACNH